MGGIEDGKVSFKDKTYRERILQAHTNVKPVNRFLVNKYKYRILVTDRINGVGLDILKSAEEWISMIFIIYLLLS